MSPCDLVLCERIVSCFVSRVDDLVKQFKFEKFFMSETDFYERNDLSGSDLSGQLVMMPGQFGVRCYKWRLCYENGFNDGNEGFSKNLEQKHKPRFFYEIECSKPSEYSFQRKHRHILTRQGWRPVNDKAFKPWTRITTRIGVEYEKGLPQSPSSYLRILGFADPHQLYHKSIRPLQHYDTNHLMEK